MSTQTVPLEWQTHAEKSSYRTTPSYADTIIYAKRLADASPNVRYESFGLSGEGRELPLLIATEGEPAFDPESANRANKALVLVQACIHAGEPDGKDAGFALLRDIAVLKMLSGTLTNVVLLFIPIYNTDGHERSSPYNRINQNGPEEMGWRTTSTYQNLNRDYMKADTPETRAWLGLWNRWQPHLFIDCHVTDGADYQYNITYQYEHHDGVNQRVLDWEHEVFDRRVAPATEAAGNRVSWYLEFIDNRDLSLGIRDFNGSPRFSTGYTPLRNRPGILIETHMLKEYRSRVLGTYEFLKAALREVNDEPDKLRDVVTAAEQQSSAILTSKENYPLDFALTDDISPYELKALSYRTEHSEISDTSRVIFENELMNITVPMYRTFRATTTVKPPVYYIVPRQWEKIIDVLKVHGIAFKSLTKATSIEIESYRFTNVRWPTGPFEGRLMPQFSVEPLRESRTYLAQSVVVPLEQSLAKLVINLLEPEAPDSLVRWGFFNAIFEQKEYGEAYVVEALARQMLAEDKSLRDQFNERLRTDAHFRSDPAARLDFFYRRSHYWDPQINMYPVGRVMKRGVVE
ncbi:MAG: M14 family metallopeptidase [Pyrinomonadaceae bacterium]